ncbi:hypothetical protein H3T80_09590 [Gilliamella sp. W8145]|nr:hypothetical protein [Gilliamella sp. W8145]MBI0104398.1 hypothetical protein [Gilliamella sp. W8145]
MFKKIIFAYFVIAFLVAIYNYFTLPSNGNTPYMLGVASAKGISWLFRLF